jgi:WD40 repeat protein
MNSFQHNKMPECFMTSHGHTMIIKSGSVDIYTYNFVTHQMRSVYTSNKSEFMIIKPDKKGNRCAWVSSSGDIYVYSYASLTYTEIKRVPILLDYVALSSSGRYLICVSFRNGSLYIYDNEKDRCVTYDVRGVDSVCMAPTADYFYITGRGEALLMYDCEHDYMYSCSHKAIRTYHHPRCPLVIIHDVHNTKNLYIRGDMYHLPIDLYCTSLDTCFSKHY